MMSNVKIFGVDVPVWALSSGLLYASGVAGEVLHSYVYPDTDKNIDIKSTVIGTGLTAGANVLAWNVVSNGGASAAKGVVPFCCLWCSWSSRK
jgi:hypothetical protein